MSLVDGDHIIPARERHGAHYFQKARPDGKLVPAMKMRVGDPHPGDKICKGCLRTPFSNETKICPRCGGEIE